MADLADVLSALVSSIGTLAYPSGVTQPQSVPPPNSSFCMPVKIFPGWPVAEQLAADLKAGVCNVSVYPRPEERNTTRYGRQWQTLSVNTPTLTLAISGQTVTVAGTVPNAGAKNPHNAMVMANGKPYVYAVQPTDTLTAVAAALAALVVADVAGTSATGAVIALPSTARIQAARIGVTGTSGQELKRQERVFQIGIWADSPAHRDAIAGPIDQLLAATDFLTLTDGYAARIIYKGSPMSDALEKSGLFRRDLYYTVEFATVKEITATQVTQIQTTVEVPGPDGTVETVATFSD